MRCSGLRRWAIVAVITLSGLPASGTAAAGTATTLNSRSLGLGYDTGWSHDENSGSGYAYFSATTVVDCAHTRVGFRQSADIFTGGYTHARNGSMLSYADMGILLENDELARGQVGRPNKVQLYGQASTRGGHKLLRFSNVLNAPQHVYNVVCDTALRLTFFVNSSSEIDIAYAGIFVRKTNGAVFRGQLTARITGLVPADGWTISCRLCAVRRVNTLAVSSGSPTRPGTYFAIRGERANREAVGGWTASVEGRYEKGPPGRRDSYVSRKFLARQSDIINAPEDAEARRWPVFLVNHEGRADEQIGLDER